VTDPSGAGIPGAQVTVTNETTGGLRSATTGGSGVYNVPDLNIGIYRVRVEAKGFEVFVREHLTLDARQILDIDAQLTVGAVTEQVTVTGAAPVIDTETPTIANTQNQEEILMMPLVARLDNTLQDFNTYNPGMTRDSAGDAYANGNRYIDQMHSIDGIEEMANPSSVGNSTYMDPGIESVGELTVITGLPNAEYATSSNFIITTKSGSNEFHGSLFYLYNGNALNSRSFFSSTVPFRVTDDFAGSVGGPIKKNKLFFWADWEGLFTTGQTLINITVPTTQWTQGNFSNLLPKTQLVNPYTGAAIPGNILSNAGLSINPTALAMQNYIYPLPNYGAATLTSGNYRTLLGVPGHDKFNPLDIRMDYNVGPRDAVFGRFTYRNIPANGFEQAPPVASPYLQRIVTTADVLSWTHSFGPHVVNELRTGVDRVNKTDSLPGQGGSAVNTQLGVEGVPPAAGFSGLFQASISNVTSVTAEYQDLYVTDNTINVIDNLSWTRGAHLIKFGFQGLRDQNGTVFYSNSMFGGATFNGTYTGNAYADFLLGLPQSSGYANPNFRPMVRGSQWSMYAQDDWKVNRRLTVDYGVRYQLSPPYHDKLGRYNSFDPSTGDIVIPNAGVSQISPLFPGVPPVVTASSAGYPTNLIPFQKANFYPRLGVAYKLTSNGNTVIRAGFGIFGDTVYPSIGWSLAAAGAPPYIQTVSFTNSTAAQLIATGTPLFSLPSPFLPKPWTSAPTLSVAGYNRNFKTPYTEEWDISLERQMRSFGLSANYTGLHAVNLPFQRNLDQVVPTTAPFSFSNQPYPSVTAITWNENGGSDEMNEFELVATKRTGRNLLLNSGYTWARDLTDQQANGGPAYGGSKIQNAYNRAADWGRDTNVPTNRFYASVEYALPAGHGQRFLNNMSNVADGFLGGWRVSLLGTLNSGLPFTPAFSGYDPSGTNVFSGRPDVIPGVSTVPPGGRTLSEWFNPAAFKVPGCPDSTPICSVAAAGQIGRFGNAANHDLVAPDLKNLDLSVFKNIRVHERVTLQVQAIATDAFNHANFAAPAATITATTTVGTITGTSTDNYLQGSSGTNRAVYLGLRLSF
jgi:hypothetical protein